MAKHIEKTSKITAAGNVPKIIEEFVGMVNTQDDKVSIALMKSPQGWSEPGQKPEFTEYTIVLRGCVKSETQNETFLVRAGEAFVAGPGEWVRYCTPDEGGAEYVAVCIPAFSPMKVHRDDE